MEHISLLPGIFKDSQEKGKEYLYYLDIDRLTAPCYEAAGLKPKKKRYGGWEEREISGHSLGHFLSAAAFMVETTKDEELIKKLRYAVDELEFLQNKDNEGYVSGFPKDCFEKVFSGEFEVERFSLGGSWVPWYSIHKIYAGLIDVYQSIGYEKALKVVIKLADWAKHGTDRLNDEQFQKMLYCEFGGMKETLAALYEITENEDYLKLAKRFCHTELLEDLGKGIDNLEGKHANTQIPKILGAAKLFSITGEEYYKQISIFFWNEVVYNRTYVIGGNSKSEHFGRSGTEPLGVSTAETCNTYNMLKLSAYLFEWDQDSRYMEYYERALYNHILASQDPDTGMKAYFMSTEPGHFKIYCDPEDSFWCCTGSGMENPARYHKHIYFYKEKNERKILHVNLFISSRYEDLNRELILEQNTQFPYSQTSSIRVIKAPKSEFEIALRIPEYSESNFKIRINDEEVKGTVVKGYMLVKRLWREGDIIEISVPLKLSVHKAMDDSTQITFMYGPVVLASALGTEGFPETDIQKDHLKLLNHEGIRVPVLVTDESDLTAHVKPVDMKSLHFVTDAIGQPGLVSFMLKPFWDLHHERYTIYFRCLSHAKYEKSALTSETYQEKLQKITLDYVAPYEQQSEIEHKITTDKSTSGYSSKAGQGWREAKDGGFFSYSMKVHPQQENYLCVTYWGSDTDLWAPDGIYPREFKIYSDGMEIAVQLLKETSPSMLFDVFYKIPLPVTQGKNQVEIKFKSLEKTLAGRIFGVRSTTQRPQWNLR